MRPCVATSIHRKVKKRLEKRFKKPDDPLKIVIVRDMWLTGFDVPCLTTMYVDKPMQDHNLMQAIARVNRVFRDKPGGLIVDYIGIATRSEASIAGVHGEQGHRAAHRSGSGDAAEGSGRDGDCAGDAAWGGLQRLSRECVEADAGGGGPHSRPGGWEEAVCGLRSADDAGLRAVLHITCVRSKYREEIAFMQAVRTVLTKRDPTTSLSDDAKEHALRQILSHAVVSAEVMDIFQAAGLERPDVGILSDEFLEDVRKLKEKNLAVEVLERLLKGGSKADLAATWCRAASSLNYSKTR